MEKTAGGACLGENISHSVGHIRYLSEDVKEAVGYINMEFRGALQAGNINLGSTSKQIKCKIKVLKEISSGMSINNNRGLKLSLALSRI